ncbi:MAG: HAMP domain-containing histidine kinase [Gemmatimonadetes bacterium]|nr:HAMP domain-containing histidine kinase [Gemmatimonadota bacterium]
MTFRTRLFLSYAGVVLVPLAVLLFGVRREVDRRLTFQVRERVSALASIIRTDLREQSAALTSRLNALSREAASDNSFRLALRAPAERRYLLDYAGSAMRRAGMALLQLQDSAGRILSSGHFRNEYDRSEPQVVPLLARAKDGPALLRARTPEGFVVVLARLDSIQVFGQRLWVIGGLRIDRGWLNRLYRDPEIAVTLRLPDDSGAVGDSVIVSPFSLPYIDAAREGESRLDTAQVVVMHSLAPLARLRRDVNLWFAIVALATAAAALALAGWMAAHIGGPLEELAEKTSQIDLDRLNVQFESDGEDEVGALSRLLGQMTERLRAGSARLREAERRATVGDLARQLNHDVKNGLVPIRNVFRHLAQVARESPADLPAVLLERQRTVEAGIEYLENLARNYARLSPELGRQPCDLNAVIAEVAAGTASQDRLRLALAPSLPRIAADPLVVRRILENLVSNAVESLPQGSGTVTIATFNGDADPRQPTAESHESRPIRLTVTDTGRGMTEEQLERAFEDFYTTKAAGTGLGLSIVRRLVLDLNGSMRVETAPGSGTRFIIDFPVAETAGRRVGGSSLEPGS